MKKIVISGINIVAGGMMSVFKDCLRELLKYDKEASFTVLVHKKELFVDIQDSRLSYMEFPKAKRSWLLRCYYEYIYFYSLSKQLKPDLWFSMHDMSPRVDVKAQVVYCHNASPFFKLYYSEFCKDITFTLFVLFYKYLYKMNIHSNKYVIVQQNWMRRSFERLYGVNNVIVAHPVVNLPNLQSDVPFEAGSFIYPATPQMYKNIEILCEAGKLIDDKRLKLYITIDGSENRYAAQIVKKYNDVSSVYFIGRQPREKIFEYYNQVEGLLFPSRLESWGMPLSEFAQTGKVILAADLDYAHEVLEKYEQVRFLSVYDAKKWAEALLSILHGKKVNKNLPFPSCEDKDKIVVKSWKELFAVIEK